MIRVRAVSVILVAILACPSLVEAARLTDVLDAANGKNDPIDFTMSVDFKQEFEWAMITRERNTLSSLEKMMLNQNEFSYKAVKNQIIVNGAVGLYHDLEFHIKMPISVSETYTGSMSGHWRDKFWGGEYSTAPISQQSRSELTPGPSLLTDRVFGFASWKTVHSGFGDMTIGFSYAPLSEERDEMWPSWVVTLDMQLPTGPEQKPKMDPAASSLLKGTASGIGVGEKLFSFIFATAISKRAGVADPYFGMHYKAPIAVGGLIGDPRHEGGFLLGTEIVAYEEIPSNTKEPEWKVAFDLRLSTTLYGKGQNFNEITDALAWRKDKDNDASNTFWPIDPRGSATSPHVYYYYPGGRAAAYELPTEGRYAYIEGLVGFYATIYHYLLLKAECAVGHRTEHFLSLPESVDSYTLRPLPSDGYHTQINEVGARVKKEKSLVVAYTLTIGLTY
ncbi:MAG: hypothetical protein C4523_07535 [Myxococcales bacterium]|nr:MAG: hypothetical protein C4523_07535 [Myxococcales bacterium]